MAKKELKQIMLKTVPNGYSLSVDGTECMYFNEVDMLAGFLTHVGLCESANMDRGMMGGAYADQVTTLKQRVGLLSSQYNTTIERMDKAMEYVSQAEKAISGLMNRIAQIDTQLKATEADHAKNKKVVDDTSNKLADIQARSNQVMNSLANTATILKTLEESAEGAKTKKTSKKGDAGDEDGGRRTIVHYRPAFGDAAGARGPGYAAGLGEGAGRKHTCFYRSCR